MMRIVPAIVLLAPMLAAPCYAGQGQATDLAAARSVAEQMRAFSAAGQIFSADARKLYSGDWLEKIPTDGKDHGFPLLPPITALVATGKNTVIARMSGPEKDLYFYLRRGADKKWTIESGRMFVLPASVPMLRTDLEARKDRTAEEDATLRNLRLMMKTDAELIQWFGTHRNDLDALLVLGGADGAKLARRALDEDTTAIGTVIRKLDLRALDAQDGFIRVTIGGVLSESVGFLRVPPGGKPPPMGACSYIWVEPLGGGWYLYRST